uniref:hypothetical chloroplast RF20 n=1 Tax=Hormidiella parvula TaxID=2058785 RepID=UPI00286A9191|nr:hypothetical chloroplast RF20 [Hormidiella parvula]WKT06003.1 hypothetical chloroplast RF20 [Hormidiella parvula]
MNHNTHLTHKLRMTTDRPTRIWLYMAHAARHLVLEPGNQRLRWTVRVALLLAGFFQATALSTVLGQTGDWDVLVSGALVALSEMLGLFMYSPSKRAEVPTLRGQPSTSASHSTSKIGMIKPLLNQFKIGLMYGLFVDAFKLGS